MPLPALVRLAEPLMAPESAQRWPASTPIVVLTARVIAPLRVLVPPASTSAVPPDTPVPAMSSALAMATPPERSSFGAVPSTCWRLPVPSAVSSVARTRPVETVMVLSKVLAPLSCSRPPPPWSARRR